MFQTLKYKFQLWKAEREVPQLQEGFRYRIVKCEDDPGIVNTFYNQNGDLTRDWIVKRLAKSRVSNTSFKYEVFDFEDFQYREYLKKAEQMVPHLPDGVSFRVVKDELVHGITFYQTPEEYWLGCDRAYIVKCVALSLLQNKKFIYETFVEDTTYKKQLNMYKLMQHCR